MRSDPIPSLPRDLGTARRGAPGYPIGSARRRAASIGERVRAELEMEGDRHRTLAAFLQPRRPVAARRPYPASLPSGIRVVDAAVYARGIGAQRVGTRSTTHFPFTSANSASFRCRSRSARRCRARAYCADRPRCNSSPRRCCRRCRQTPARILVEGPALRAVIAGGFGPVQRILAFARSKLPRWPLPSDTHTPLAVDVGAAWRKAEQRTVVDFSERSCRRVRAGIEPRDRTFPPNTPTVPHTEPSTGLGMIA